MTKVEQFVARIERERRENGLIEFHVTRGSDDDVSIEEAAAVALAMIEYEPN